MHYKRKLIFIIFIYFIAFASIVNAKSQKNILSASDYKKGNFIGEIIAWPFADYNPPNNWLECNGQLIDKNLYPQLFAIMQKTPDYTNNFISSKPANTIFDRDMHSGKKPFMNELSLSLLGGMAQDRDRSLFVKIVDNPEEQLIHHEAYNYFREQFWTKRTPMTHTPYNTIEFKLGYAYHPALQVKYKRVYSNFTNGNLNPYESCCSYFTKNYYDFDVFHNFNKYLHEQYNYWYGHRDLFPIRRNHSFYILRNPYDYQQNIVNLITHGNIKLDLRVENSQFPYELEYTFASLHNPKEEIQRTSIYDRYGYYIYHLNDNDINKHTLMRVPTEFTYNSESEYTHPKFVRVRYFIRAK